MERCGGGAGGAAGEERRGGPWSEGCSVRIGRRGRGHRAIGGAGSPLGGSGHGTRTRHYWEFSAVILLDGPWVWCGSARFFLFYIFKK